MKREMENILHVAVRVALGLVFVYAGVLKIIDPVAFAGSVAAYKILPYGLNYLVAAILPWVEVVCGTLLIAGYRVRASACIIIAMNLVFMIALASTIVRGLNIDCGCFGAGKTSKLVARDVGLKAIVEDVVWLGMALFVYFRKKRKPQIGW